MSFDHFYQFFTLAAAGLGLFLAGVLNLALGRGGRRVWLRLVLTLVACGAVVAGLSALTRVELALRAAAVVFGVLTVATLLGSEWLVRQVSALVAYCRRPAPRWGLVAGAGLLVLIGSGLAFDVAEEDVLDQSMKELDMLTGRPVTQPVEQAFAATDRGTRVVLREPTAARNPDDLAGPEEKTLRDVKVHSQLIRRGGPADYTNCHGWVFTGGKFILAPEDVEAIIKENGYQETHAPQPGDLVIYRQSGTITHTARSSAT